MKTITIEDPAEVLAALRAEFVSIKPMDLTANYSASGWTLYIWTSPNIRGEGPTADEALANLRENYAKHDPAEKLREQAAALGMKLVPA